MSYYKLLLSDKHLSGSTSTLYNFIMILIFFADDKLILIYYFTLTILWLCALEMEVRESTVVKRMM